MTTAAAEEPLPENPEWCREADPKLYQRFCEYNDANPWVWKEFLRKARLIRARGRERYSAWTIVQVIRWETDIGIDGGVFKINNDYIALYARAAEFVDEKLAGLFELREMKPERRMISREQRDREDDGEDNAPVKRP